MVGRVARRGPTGMSIELDEGRVLDMSVRSPPDAEAVRVDVVRPIAPRTFDDCPICGDPATDDEHVPPASMGGAAMTRTCAPCNNRLGSNVEADLADWYDRALTLPEFSGAAVEGRRRSGRILLRTSPAGEWVLVIEGNHDPAVIELLRSGKVDLDAAMPDPNRYHLGLLKQAYLAACLEFGGPPAEAADVRADLIAARDAPDRHSVPASPLAAGLEVLRVDGPVGPGVATLSVAVAYIHDTPTAGVLLAGSVFVSWSSDLSRPTTPVPTRRLRVSLDVGGKIDGVIRAAE